MMRGNAFGRPIAAECSAKVRRVLIPALLLLLLFGSYVRAEEGMMELLETLPEVPADIPPLPGPRDEQNRLFVDQQNVALFHELLVAPLASWIKEGGFILRVVRNLDFKWELSPEWKRATQESLGAVSLDDQQTAALPQGSRGFSGFPFGTAEDLKGESDLRRKALKILWNIAAVQTSQRDVLYGLELAWVGRQSLLRRSEGIFYRRAVFEPLVEKAEAADGKSSQASAAAASPDSSPVPSKAERALPVVEAAAAKSTDAPFVLFEDVLQLHSPPVVLGFAMLSRRYLGLQEDDVWIHSPVIGRNRKVLQANRSDALLGGLLGYDDLFVDSQKVESVFAEVVGDKVLLVPFPSLNLYRMEKERVLLQPGAAAEAAQGQALETAAAATTGQEFEDILTVRGYHQRTEADSSFVLWNYETAEWPQAAPWNPTTVVFVPRQVWILNLSSKDPFYRAGRQILVVDQETMLPVYKIVYDQVGEYRETIMGGWLLASTEEGSIRLPLAAFLLAVSRGNGEVTALSTHYGRTFLGQDTAASRELKKLLDIANHLKAAEKGPEKEEVDGKDEMSTADAEAKPSEDGEAGGSEETAEEASEPSTEGSAGLQDAGKPGQEEAPEAEAADQD